MTKKSRPLIAMFGVSLLLGACDLSGLTTAISDAVLKATQALGDAVAQIGNDSSSWQQVLQDTTAKLTEDGQQTIRGDVQNLLDRGIASAGTEARCSTDFVGGRIKNGLEELKDELLGQPYNGPMPEPALCNVTPMVIDLSLNPEMRNYLTVGGYDLDTMPIQAVLRNKEGDQDISPYLSLTSHYLMTLNLSNNGVHFSASSQEIVFKWDGKEQSSIQVLQPGTPVCKTTQIQQTPSPIDYMPPHIDGDASYGGTGADVVASAVVLVEGDAIYVDVSMSAEENGGDHTYASGGKRLPIYKAPPGMLVNGVTLPALGADIHYASAPNYFGHDSFTGTGPVSSWDFRIDEGRNVNSAGVYTGVSVRFNPFGIQLLEDGSDGHCVTPPGSIKRTLDLAWSYFGYYVFPQISFEPSQSYTNAGASFILGSYSEGQAVKMKASCGTDPMSGRATNPVWVGGPCNGSRSTECSFTMGTAPLQESTVGCAL